MTENGAPKLKKLLFFLLLAMCSTLVAAQRNDTILVRERYFGTPLLKVLKDFEQKYGLSLKYDSALISKYKFDYLYMGTPPQVAFDAIFRDLKDISYFTDKDGFYRIVETKNLPKNRTQLENRQYEGRPVRKNLTVFGRVKDITNGEPLPFATIEEEGTSNGATTNNDGYFTLYNVTSDVKVLVIKYLGYETQRFYLSPEINVTNILIELQPAANQLNEVVIVKTREDVLKIPEGIGIIQTTAAKIAELPSMGEKDIFRTFQLMPGVAGSNEASAGMYVRGGTPDQNLILYDGFTIYHQEHLMGVFSSFNPNAIKDVQLHKGGFDAKYGGRLSSVMEIVGKTGNDKQFNIGGDVGFLGFNAFVEAPFGNEKGSIFIAGRRSFQSFLYNQFTKVYSENRTSLGGGRMTSRNQSQPKSYFYDLNGKLTYNPTKRDIFSLSFFNGEDNLDNSRSSFGSSFMGGSLTDKTDWGNIGSSMKWSRNWNNLFYSNILASFSNYYSLRNRLNNQEGSNVGRSTVVMFNQQINENNQLWDYSLKMDNEYKFSTQNKLEFGLNYSKYHIDYSYSREDSVSILSLKNRGNLLSLYGQDRWMLTDKLTVLPGVRLSYYDATAKIYPEPRAQLYYNATDRLRFKASAGLYYQFTNRIVREDISAGSRDIWLLSDDKAIPVSNAIHYVAGGTYETKEYLFDIEAYYKNLHHISEYTLRFVPNFIDNSNYSEFFYTGKGYSRGADFLIQKKLGQLTGWIGYTLSETRYSFPVYGNGYFPANQDVTNEFKTVMIYKPVKDLTFSATWIYATGKPYTAPAGGYVLNTPNGGNLSFLVVEGKNNARYPDYHRLDFSAKWDVSAIKEFKSSISLSLFNVYDHVNVWYKEFMYDPSVGLSATNVNLLGFTPTLTFSVQLR